MKIGIDARMYGPRVSGIGNYVQYLTDTLFRIDTKNEYTLFVLQENDTDIVLPKNVKKVLVTSYWYSLSEQTRFVKDIYRQKLDLVHFPNFNTPILYRKNFIATIHDITPKFFPGEKQKNSLVRRLAYKAVMNHSLKKSCKIITVSQHSKNAILQNFAVPPSKISVTPLGFPQDFAQSDKNGIISRLNQQYRVEKPYILFIGVFREHKNIVGLLHAYKILLKKHKVSHTLVLAGDSSNAESSISKTISQLNLENFVHITGFIDSKDLKGLYQYADVVVIPSFHEGFGLHGLEAIACNTPVVASSTTSLPEVLGSSALYFNPKDYSEMADVMYSVMNDEHLRNKLKKQFPKILQKYSWENCAKKTLAIYESCNNKDKKDNGEKAFGS